MHRELLGELKAHLVSHGVTKLHDTDGCCDTGWYPRQTTNQRLQLTSFSRPLYEDIVKLIVLKDEDSINNKPWIEMTWREFWDETWTKLKVPARPFSSDGWLAILVTVVIASIALHIIEPEGCEFDWKKADPKEEELQRIKNAELWDDPDDSVAHRLETYVGKTPHSRGSWFWSFLHFLSGLLATLYFGIVGLVVGDPKHEVHTLSGRILNVGFAMFGVVILASYTASLAGLILMSTAETSTISNLQDVQTVQGNLCFRASMVPHFVNHYPNFDETRIAQYDTLPCTAECGEGASDCVPVGECQPTSPQSLAVVPVLIVWLL